jgi:hypothetical protein
MEFFQPFLENPLKTGSLNHNTRIFIATQSGVAALLLSLLSYRTP